MTQDIISIYSARAEQYRTEQKIYTKQLAWLSAGRLLLFIGFTWFLVAAFRIQFRGLDWLYALACIGAFTICVARAAALQKKNRFLQQLVLINENEQNTLNGLPSFLANGSVLAPAKGFTV